MQISFLNHRELSKFLVGETLNFQVQSPQASQFDLELFTNANRESINHRFKLVDSTFTCTLLLTKSGFFKWHLRVRARNTKKWHWLTDDQGQKIQGNFQVDPEWVSQAIVYSVFVRFFKGKIKSEVQRQPAVNRTFSDNPEELEHKSINPLVTILPGEGGTFDDVKAHLDELRQMSINVLYFNPIHKIGQLFRGYNMLDQLPGYLQPGSPYSIQDYKSIDPELTYDKDTKKHLLSDPQQEFKDLIDAAHQRGMYVIMDLVFNHTAHDFVFQRIRPEWYLYKENITSLEDPYLYPEEIHQGKPWGDPKHTVAPYDHGVWWEDCAQLNWEYKLPEAPNKPPPNPFLKEMWEYLKSIPSYWIRHFGVDGFRCDVAYRVPPEFWKACIAESRELACDLRNNLSSDVIFIAESYTSDLKELQQAGFSAVYGDFSHKLYRPNQLKGYLDYIYNLQGPNFPQGSRWFNFPDSHDFDRSPRKVLGDQMIQADTALLANQSRWLLTATLPGMPLIFNGFEKIEWQPINIWSYGAIDWERDLDLRNFIAKVNRIRHWHLALSKGNYTFLSSNQGLDDNTQIFAYQRSFQDQNIIIVVNMDVHRKAGPAIIYLPAIYNRAYTLTDLLTDKTFSRSGCELLVELNPGDSHIFQVNFLG